MTRNRFLGIRSIALTVGGIAIPVIQTPRTKIQGFTLGYSGVLIVASRTMSVTKAMIRLLAVVSWTADGLRSLAGWLDQLIDRWLTRLFEDGKE
jgi:hypothetical protein